MPYKNPEDKRAAMKRWRRKNPNKYRKQETAYMRKWREKNRRHLNEYQKKRYKFLGWRWHLKKKFNMTPEQFDTMLKQQGGCCAICKTVLPENERYNVDHDHTTSQVRGLLCGLCNTGLGSFKDKIEVLLSAAQYLTFYKPLR